MSTTIDEKPRTKLAAEEEARREQALADYARHERSEFQRAITRRQAKGVATDPKVREAIALLDEDAHAHERRAWDLAALADGWDSGRASERAKDEGSVASDIHLLALKLAESRDVFLDGALDKLLATPSNRPMSAESFKVFRSQVGSAIQCDEANAALHAMARRHYQSASNAAVIAEPPPYGVPGNSASWFRDIATATAAASGDLSQTGPVVAEAQERLSRHAYDVTRAIRSGSAYGKRAEQALLEQVRSDDLSAHKRARAERAREIRETRAISTGGGTTLVAASGGAAFVPPAFIGDLFAPYLQRAPFRNAIATQDLPEFGLEVYVPALSSDASVTQQTEGLSIAEVDPTATYLSGAVETFAGVLTVSQQLWDRSGGPDGVTADSAYAKQLGIDLAKAQDSQALTAAIASGGSVIYNAASFALAGTSGVGGFIDKLASAKYAIRGTAGGYLEPSSVFFTPERWEYIFGYADAQGRPIVLPEAAEDAPRQYGDTGLEWGGLHVWTDPNIPLYGTTSEDQVIVADESEVFFFRSPVPMLQAFPQTDALTLQIVIRLYAYSATIARHANAVQVISGTGLAPITF